MSTSTGRHKSVAQALGVGHFDMVLSAGSVPRTWSHDGLAPKSVEEAALDWFRTEGWDGHAQEGGLILTLIKAASFPALPERLHSTFIEALYAGNVALAQDQFVTAELLTNIDDATDRRIEQNFAVMSRPAWGRDGFPGCQFFPTVTLPKLLGLFNALGNTRLKDIATKFAEAPYDYRAGWPDLTLWRGNDVCFTEIKAPGDRLHASQKRLLLDLLVTLGHMVQIVDVTAKSVSDGPSR